jgi:hypothetical protein
MRDRDDQKRADHDAKGFAAFLGQIVCLIGEVSVHRILS